MNDKKSSKHLTISTVNLKTRDQIRRVETGKSTSNTTNGNGSTSQFGCSSMDGERQPLLGHQATSTLHPEPGFWGHLLFSAKSSPGTNSPNPFVRWPAQVWNVTKITLFSCGYPVSPSFWRCAC